MSARPRKQRAQRLKPQRLLKGRVWVEVGGKPAINDAAADLLEQIGVSGSLSEAARSLGFSYRRAWLLLAMMNRQWPQPLVHTSTGGRRGGGATLTELGHRVLRTYRDLQIQLEHLLSAAGDPFIADV